MADWGHENVVEGEVRLDGERFGTGDAAAQSKESRIELVAAKSSQVLLLDLYKLRM